MKSIEKRSCKCGNKRLRSAIISICVAAAVIITAVVAAVAYSGSDARPYHAEFARRSIIKTEETTSAVTSGDSGSDTAAVSEKVPEGLKHGALKCTLTMEKTAWAAGETPQITLKFGLIDDSYGEGSLRLRLDCDDFSLSREVLIENYTYDTHGFADGKAPDSVDISLVRGGKTGDAENGGDALPAAPTEFAYGKLYLSFEFIPAESNKVFSDDDHYYDGDDEDMIEPTPDGVWVGGFWCAYAVTPAQTCFARRDTDSGEYFARRVIKQYRDGMIDDKALCRAYYFLALHNAVYISATSPISDGTTRLGYYSPTLRAVARQPVSDEEILLLVSQTGPYPKEHDEDLEVSMTRTRELGVLILGVLKEQGVITEAEHAAGLAELVRAEDIVTSPPEFNRAFKKYRKLIEDELITHE